jgi:uncharacterized protein YfaP (DUF2135 family)
MKPIPLLALLLAAPASAQVTIDSPGGGWRNSGGRQEQYTQGIHYPASSVNMQPGQSGTAQIRGRVKGTPKEGEKKPATLVVNGVPMPVEVGEDGSFARPYSFGSGANGIEVRAPNGKSRARAQFYDANAGKTQARLRVVLTWDTPGTDLDLHVVSPDGGHAWYGNQVMGNGGTLDVDVTTGYGPEIFSSAAPSHGMHHVYVNYYGGAGAGAAITVAQLAIITNEGTPREKQQVFRIPMRAPGELTLVKSFVFP